MPQIAMGSDNRGDETSRGVYAGSEDSSLGSRESIIGAMIDIGEQKCSMRH